MQYPKGYVKNNSMKLINLSAGGDLLRRDGFSGGRVIPRNVGDPIRRDRRKSRLGHERYYPLTRNEIDRRAFDESRDE